MNKVVLTRLSPPGGRWISVLGLIRICLMIAVIPTLVSCSKGIPIDPTENIDVNLEQLENLKKTSFGVSADEGESIFGSSEKKPRDDLFFVSTISGGGYRAANFGLGHLLALDSIMLDESTTLLDEMDYLSTVSGGGLAGALYLVTMVEHLKCHPMESADSIKDFIFLLKDKPHRVDMLRKSWAMGFVRNILDPRVVTPTVSRSDLFHDDYYRDLIAINDCDNDEVENEGKESSGQAHAEHDGMLTIGEVESFASRGLPVHVPNSTISTSGHVLPFVSDALTNLGINCYIDSRGWKYVSKAKDLPYSLGLMASATFPPFWNDMRLARWDDSKEGGECDPKRFFHLTDGGQSDDNGYITALGILNEVIGKKPQSAPSLLLVVDALNRADRLEVDQEAPAGFGHVALVRNTDLPR